MTNSNNLIDQERLFRRLALLTIATIYLLILAGGIVRSTGSGMGCPDWPKCFGQWVPPTNVSQLPDDYQSIYAHKGYADTTFNATKTWIEYLNRLLGALTGLFILATSVVSLRFAKRDPIIPFLSWIGLILTGVQGWLGAKVVSNLLVPWLVTLHMLVAIVIVGLLLYITARSFSSSMARFNRSNIVSVRPILIISTMLLLAQILLGTQVREQIDEIANKLGQSLRSQWVSQLGLPFIVHRSFSLIVFSFQLVWVWRLFAAGVTGIAQNLATWVIALILVEILTGVIMAYVAVPAFAQPVHLTLAVVVLGMQFVLLLFLKGERMATTETKLSATEM
jgi:heme a synthase